jgi:Polyketide cyclase / dehydrase and lipid transport
MVIDESILVDAPLERVWDVFTNLSAWREWNTVVRNISPSDTAMREGARFRCSVSPFVLPVFFEVLIEEVVVKERIAWTASQFGVYAWHEFIFREVREGVLVGSKECLQGPTVTLMGVGFPDWKLRELTRSLLVDLKKAAEKGQ